MREAEVFGINHKFAVNADQYDVNNPDRYRLLSSQTGTVEIPKGHFSNGGYQTVPEPFNLSNNH